MKQKVTTLQIITGILIVFYLIWEKNVQDYLSINELSNNTSTRVDLFVIVPVLLVLVVISIRQYFRKK